MQSSEKITKAGDVLIEKVQITTTKGFYQDITSQVMGIQIFEDIFSPFITGTIEIRDGLDLLNVFPFNGDEFLELKLSTPTLESGNIDCKFYIFKMTNRTMVGDRATVYTLNFISQEAITDINKKISKAFNGKVSDIVNKILLDEANGLNVKKDKKLNIEQTKNSTAFIANFWSPIRCINDLTETAINQRNSGSFVFFENRYGFNFVSLESLYDNPNTYQEFVYDNYIRDKLPNSTDSIKNVEEDYKRVRTVNIPVAYDYIERASSGMLSSRLFTYDILTKRFNDNGYNMLDNHSNFKHLNDYPLASNKTIYRNNSFVMAMTKYTGNFSGYGDVTNASIIQNRISSLSQINANKVEITVAGRMDYTVGQKINLKLFKVEPNNKDDNEVIDEMFSGNYIVAAINHFINRNMHECTIEIVKESIMKNLNKG